MNNLRIMGTKMNNLRIMGITLPVGYNTLPHSSLGVKQNVCFLSLLVRLAGIFLMEDYIQLSVMMQYKSK